MVMFRLVLGQAGGARCGHDAERPQGAGPVGLLAQPSSRPSVRAGPVLYANAASRCWAHE